MHPETKAKLLNDEQMAYFLNSFLGDGGGGGGAQIIGTNVVR